MLHLEEKSTRVLDEFRDTLEETGTFSAVQESVVVAQGDVHDWAGDNLVSSDYWSVDDVVHAHDGGLWRVNNRSTHHGTEDTTVGQGEGTSTHVFWGNTTGSSSLSEVLESLC